MRRPVRAVWCRAVCRTALLALALTACGPEPLPPGSATVTWSFAGRSCSDAGVAQLSIVLTQPDGLTVADQRTVPCLTRSIAWKQMPVGSWTVRLEGLSAGGAKLYEAFTALNVRSGENAFDIDLQLPR